MTPPLLTNAVDRLHIPPRSVMTNGWGKLPRWGIQIKRGVGILPANTQAVKIAGWKPTPRKRFARETNLA